jgi:phage baseplate assembly protein W
MPYKNIIITPNNISNQQSVQKSQFYKGFSTADSTRLSSKIYDFDLIQQDIINIFQTRRGERVMDPQFGTMIWEMIYEPFTNDVKQRISDDITNILNYDPRVAPTRVNISEAEYGLLLEATLYYKQLDLTQDMKLGFNKDSGTVTRQ